MKRVPVVLHLGVYFALEEYFPMIQTIQRKGMSVQRQVNEISDKDDMTEQSGYWRKKPLYHAAREPK